MFASLAIVFGDVMSASLAIVFDVVMSASLAIVFGDVMFASLAIVFAVVMSTSLAIVFAVVMSTSLAIVLGVVMFASLAIVYDDISTLFTPLFDTFNDVVGASESLSTFHEIPFVSSFCFIASDGLSKNTTSLIFCGVIA